MADASTNRRRNRRPTAAAAVGLLLAAVLALGLIPNVSAGPAPARAAPLCGAEYRRRCHDRAEALKLKVVAIAAILATSMIGVGAPLFFREVPALKPDRKLFEIKAIDSGVILATVCMRVMSDYFDPWRSKCLPEVPWRNFPFTTFVAMLSAVITLMVDSYAMAHYKKINAEISGGGSSRDANGQAKDAVVVVVHGGADAHLDGAQLLRHRVVAQVLELGIVVHSVVIGLLLGASDNPCTIRPLIAALCFHQMFEGMGLGGCILQAEFGLKVKLIMAFFFSATTPFRIALGIGLSNVYSDSSPAALIVEELLNASSVGLLNYMVLVDLLAEEFLWPRLQADMKLQLFGAVFMALMTKWIRQWENATAVAVATVTATHPLDVVRTRFQSMDQYKDTSMEVEGYNEMSLLMELSFYGANEMESTTIGATNKALPVHAPIVAGPKEIIAIVQPSNFSYSTAPKNLDQRYIVKNKMEMSMEVKFSGDSDNGQESHLYSSCVTPSCYRGSHGLYIVSL
ncbi:fe(2+) transport protein 1 [Eucalyptus grandis]|uniref:fe(2+) transport protein 1 n=1 Tax=Eucalyptus grandis TaxID=71139 RepID=UPI00192EEA56|nr:fe(2+) transport protein 1 [Eucalyptus grandis]